MRLKGPDTPHRLEANAHVARIGSHVMGLLLVLNIALLLVGGALALSGLIIAHQPNARGVIEKLMPFQALIGVGMLVVGVLNLLRFLGVLVSAIKVSPLYGMSMLAMFVSAILLGLVFGMAQIAQWMPGHAQAQQKGQALVQKLIPYQMILGILGIGASLIYIAYHFNLMNPNTY